MFDPQNGSRIHAVVDHLHQVYFYPFIAKISAETAFDIETPADLRIYLMEQFEQALLEAFPDE